MGNWNGGFYFIATPIEIQFVLPYQIDESLKIEKATEAQIDVIKKSLIRESIFGKFSESYFYETTPVPTAKTETSTSWSHKPLAKKNWRYYVLTHRESNYEAYQFMMIANLIPPYIQSIVQCITDRKFGRGKVVGYGKDGLAHSAFYVPRLFLGNSIPAFKLSSIKKVKKLYNRYKALDKVKYEGIKRAIELNSRLLQVSKIDNLYILGLFMIIEMLLTHNPNNKEIGDSLNHQIKTKISFLESRLDIPFNYSKFDKNISHEKIWGALYNYRSCIAHGNHVDFLSSELKVLKNAETALDFLDKATKSILSHSIMEPDIINGLKPI